MNQYLLPFNSFKRTFLSLFVCCLLIGAAWADSHSHKSLKPQNPSVTANETAPSQHINPVYIRFGIMALKPYGYFEQKQPRGDLFDIARAVVEGDAIQGKVTIEPIKRLEQSLRIEKSLDCSIFGMVPNVVRNYDVVESIGIFVDFGILPRQGVVIHRYEDLRDLLIGHPLGISIGYPYDKDKDLKRISAKNYESGMLMLKHGRFDAIAGVIGSLKFSGKQQGVYADSYGEPYITQKLPMKVVCRPGFLSPALKEKLRQRIAELRNQGRFKAIFDQYHRQ